MSDDGGTVIPFPSNSNEDWPLEEEIHQPRQSRKKTKQDLFLAHVESQLGVLLATLASKNTDYANEDPFANFRMAEGIGVSCPRGMLVRILDKVSRVSNLIQRPPAVANESLIDTCRDGAGYFICLLVYFLMHPEAASNGE